MKLKILKNIAFFVFFIIVGGLLGYGIGSLLKSSSPAPKIPLIWLSSLIPIFLVGTFLVIFLHELGHAIAGYGVGFKFRFLTAGPFMWEKNSQNQLIFKWNKSLNTFGGLTLCLPEKTNNLRYKFALYGAGGPLMSLVSSLIFYILYQNTPWIEGSFGSFFLIATWLIFSFMSLMIFLVTIVPFQTGGFFTDGARILTLLRGGEASLIQVVILTEMSRSISGTRPRDLDKPMLLKILPGITAPMFQYSIVSYLYFIEFDQKNYAQAYIYLKNMEAMAGSLPPIFQKITALEVAYFEGAIHQNEHLTQSYLQQVGSGKDPFIYAAVYLKTEALLALLQQNYPLAIEKAQKARQEVPNLLEKGQMPFQMEMIEDILNQAQTKLSAEVSSV
ncbi:MAG: M50 family metallopeptidase [Microscillaceae bacterium]|jgi:hypothetical protein|nr:M50 family metallopeptidase [Microscillaceae bacterium]